MATDISQADFKMLVSKQPEFGVSFIQRKLSVGYNEAAKLVNRMLLKKIIVATHKPYRYKLVGSTKEIWQRFLIEKTVLGKPYWCCSMSGKLWVGVLKAADCSTRETVWIDINSLEQKSQPSYVCLWDPFAGIPDTPTTESLSSISSVNVYKGIDGHDVTINGKPLSPLNQIINHSPDGFSWGFDGSGPGQLALAIMVHEFGPELHSHPADYMTFKSEVIANFDRQAFSISSLDIENWINKKTKGSIK